VRIAKEKHRSIANAAKAQERLTRSGRLGDGSAKV